MKKESAKLIQDFEDYLFETLGLNTVLSTWKDATALPHFLHKTYIYHEFELLKESFLLMSAKKQDDMSPATIQKHLKEVEEISGKQVVFLCKTISGYSRRRLIERKISFVVPGNQLYLPLLALDLREYFRTAKNSPRPQFSPSAQILMLYVMYNWKQQRFIPSVVAKRLQYSAMTMTRAFDEIESQGLGEIERVKNRRELTFTAEKDNLWAEIFTLFQSPVKRRYQALIHSAPDLVKSGQSAMQYYKMMDDPSVPVFAVGEKRWKSLLKEGRAEIVNDFEEGYVNIEIWSYPPEIFARDSVADPLSLYLSMKDVAFSDDLLGGKLAMDRFNTYILEVMRSSE